MPGPRGALTGAVAVCTLTDKDLYQPLSKISGVAIAGHVYTPNHGIERVVQNIMANPNIRFLVLCGRDSKVFYPGQAIVSLFAHGMDENHQIINARGHIPILKNLTGEHIKRLNEQVELFDLAGVTDITAIESTVTSCLEQDRGMFRGDVMDIPDAPHKEETFKKLPLGGKQRPMKSGQNMPDQSWPLLTEKDWYHSSAMPVIWE